MDYRNLSLQNKIEIIDQTILQAEASHYGLLLELACDDNEARQEATKEQMEVFEHRLKTLNVMRDELGS